MERQKDRKMGEINRQIIEETVKWRDRGTETERRRDRNRKMERLGQKVGEQDRQRAGDTERWRDK